MTSETGEQNTQTKNDIMINTASASLLYKFSSTVTVCTVNFTGSIQGNVNFIY